MGKGNLSYYDKKGNMVLPNESGTRDPRLDAPAATPARTPKPMAQTDMPLTVYDKRRSRREMSRPVIDRSTRSRR